MVLTVPVDWHHVSVSNGTRRDHCGEPINLPFAPYDTLQKYQAKSFGWVKEVSLLLGTSQSIQKTPSFDFCSQQLVAFKNLHLKPSLKSMFRRQRHLFGVWNTSVVRERAITFIYEVVLHLGKNSVGIKVTGTPILEKKPYSCLCSRAHK